MKESLAQLKTHYFALPFNKEERRVQVLLPKDYDKDSERRYPVLYMHDGQNLFFDQESYSGKSWGLLETLNSPKWPQIIVVAIDHAGAYRLPEYAPFPIEQNLGYTIPRYSGNGQSYAEWLVTELKPIIDVNYRTEKTAEKTYIAGSSMGALISAYTASRYPDLFSGLGIFSIASWVSENAFLDFCRQNPLNKNTKVYIQVGTNEMDKAGQKASPEENQIYIDNSKNYYQTLINGGLDPNQVKLEIVEGAIHNEGVWSKTFPHFLQHLFS